MALQVAKRLFDVSEYHRIAEAGILSEDDRIELIHGEIVEMTPIGSAHAACVSRLDDLLHEKLRGRAQINVQNPMQLDDYSEPEPDIMVLAPRKDYYADALPRPADVLLIVEVADSSMDYDRRIKLPLYAQAGIPEVWLVDLNQDLIRAFSASSNGEYRSTREFKQGETISSQQLPGLTLSVDDILG
jgi:Uma2 family endonuclease